MSLYLLSALLMTMSCYDNDNKNRLTLTQHESKEYCQLEQFRATCPDDHVVLIHSAVYGRMRLGRCVKKNYGSLGCSTDVMGHVDRLCSGRPSCQFQVATLHVVNSCPGDLTPFLEARFTCVLVATAYDQKCLDSNPLVINIVSTASQPLSPATNSDFSTTPTTAISRAASASGRREPLSIDFDKNSNLSSSPPDFSPFMSSHISSSLGRGSSDCPWQLRVPAGQQINVTLFNFGRVPAPSEWSSVGFSPSKPCHNLAVFRERQSTHVLTQCEGSARLVHAYLSLGSVLEVEIRPPKSSDLHFLLHYQAVGCANPPLVHGATFRRSGEFGVMRCNATQEVHRLHCVDSRWRGMNCSWPSLPLSKVPSSGQPEDLWGMSGLFSQESFPYSILLVVSIGVALGVFIGGVLLVCTTKFLKRSGDKTTASDLQSESLDATITQLKNFPCSAGDLQLQKLLQQQQQQHHHHHQQQPQQQLCDLPEAEFFYGPRHSFDYSSSCPLNATTATTTTTSATDFYGEVVQPKGDRDDHQERKKCLVQAQSGLCQYRVNDCPIDLA